MRTIKQLTFAFVTLCIAFVSVGCDKEPVETPVNKPTIGIMEPEFDSEAMKAKVMIAPSTDATAWYYKVDSADYTKVDGAAAMEIEFAVEYGVEYTITAYAENRAGKSDIAEKKFCQMPEGEVAITLGEVTLHEESMHAMITVYPSKSTTTWYWAVVDTEDENAQIEWTADDYINEKVITFNY